MNDLINSVTMTSREIADLVESRHDKVKQSIERLAGRGVIGLPRWGNTSIRSAARPPNTAFASAIAM
jgi:phage regulator Rha-like protein